VSEPTERLEPTAATVREGPAKPAAAPPVAPAAGAPSSNVTASAVASESIVTPEQAMAQVEAYRVRAFMIGMAVLCLVTAAVVIALGGDPVAQRFHAATLASVGVLAAGYAAIFRDPWRYRPTIAMAIGYLAVLVSVTGYYYWGVFSAYAAVVPVTIYVMSSGADRTGAFIGTGLCIVVHVSLGAAQLAGVLVDRGLYGPTVASRPVQIATLVLLQLIALAALAGGRAAQRSTRDVLDQHHRALRDLAQRDAQLAEARADAQAARAGGGEGRYTGQQVGDFRLGAVLGRGAMGEVYAAERIGDGATCAVKVLAAHLLSDDAAHRRFAREAGIISALASPYVVRVLAVSPRDAALPFLAMERLDGIDLAQLVKQQPVRRLDEVVELATQVAAGLDAAHHAGVIHRDLKPQNLIAVGAATRTWKILDFGVSKWIDGDGTMSHDRIVGTPGYMAPEQARGEPVTARTDVYALGVIIYRLVTGAPAVIPGDLPAMLHEVVYRVPVQPSRLAEVSAEVEAVLAVALAKAPADRFESAGALAAALAAAAAGRSLEDVGARAAALLARSPWGGWLRRRERRGTST